MKQIDTAALAERIAGWRWNLNSDESLASRFIKQEIDAALEPLLLAVAMGERAVAVRFIRAIAKDTSPAPDVASELERVAKSIEAGFHLVMTEKG